MIAVVIDFLSSLNFIIFPPKVEPCEYKQIKNVS